VSDKGAKKAKPGLHVIHPSDNVAMALEDLSAGVQALAARGGRSRVIELRTPVPFGHKVALEAIREGERVVKYGEVIGLATQDIAGGGHVHVHNLESQRGRGDLRARS